jgi:outer membrane receptor for ferric coprogen and ferric-rhodotorulic acid
VDVNNVRLNPAKGTSIEGGIKSEWFNKRLYASAAIFRARQTGLAEAAGTFGVGGAGRVGTTYYRGVDTTSRGFELEVTGMITRNGRSAAAIPGLKCMIRTARRPAPICPPKPSSCPAPIACPPSMT